MPFVPLVIAQERGQELLLDLIARRGPPARDETHDTGIGIQLHQVVRIAHCEPAKDQSLRLKENQHRPGPSDIATLLPASAHAALRSWLAHDHGLWEVATP